jgi:hypothetical protein
MLFYDKTILRAIENSSRDGKHRKNSEHHRIKMCKAQLQDSEGRRKIEDFLQHEKNIIKFNKVTTC